ncbi:MAG: ribosome biogenesis GTP-binding protein YihA/YsxC [Bacteroidota bacterium]
MKIKSAKFIASSDHYKKCPEQKFPEYAFIGRSNVGKSSLINMLAGVSNLALTSSKPGKTKLINHFLINEQWWLADLPGYGYARVSKNTREAFTKMISSYILNRPNLMKVFVLVDSRIKPDKKDLSFVDWLGVNKIPFTILFTKTDKVSDKISSMNTSLFKKTLMETWEELPESFPVSSLTGIGKEKILSIIEDTNTLFNPDLMV